MQTWHLNVPVELSRSPVTILFIVLLLFTWMCARHLDTLWSCRYYLSVFACLASPAKVKELDAERLRALQEQQLDLQQRNMRER